MNYYDVTYKTPVGGIGVHYAVEAASKYEAASISPIMLCYGTPWKPNQFKVLKVTPFQTLQQKEKEND